MKHFIFTLTCLLALTACGSKKTNPPSEQIITTKPIPTVNLGANRVVNEGERVELDPIVRVVNPFGFQTRSATQEMEISSGPNATSRNPQDIVKLVWKKLAGPDVGFTGGNDMMTTGKFWFTAPSPGKADSLEMIYQLTITDSAGSTGSGTLKITVNRVNKKPIAAAGDDKKIDSDSTIKLSGIGSSDPDGEIKSYQWAQTAGSPVKLSDTKAAELIFTAPTANSPEEYEFELTVTDNNGAISSDKVKINVTPKNAPALAIYFPTPAGIYIEPSISVFGSAKATDTKIEKVEVGIDGIFTEAKVNNDQWRADNITMPSSGDSTEIIVKATDGLGRISEKKSRLNRTAKQQGTGQTWTKVYGLGINHEANKLMVFSINGTLLSQQKIQSVDLNSGNRSTDIYSVGPSNQVEIYRAFFDEKENTFYATTVKNSALTAPIQVVSIDIATAKRQIISDTSHGTGIAFNNLAGITASANGQLYVADNGGNSVLKIDTATGNRTVIADKTTQPEPVDYSIDVAMDPTDTEAVYFLPNSTLSYLLKLNTKTNPTTSELVTDSSDKKVDPIKDGTSVQVDLALNKAFILEESGTLHQVNLTTGDRSTINSVSAQAIGYDHSQHLMYFNEKNKNAIWALDVVSGHKLLISGQL